eukprot:PhF_6_TR7853/c1_g1_i1/m.11457
MYGWSQNGKVWFLKAKLQWRLSLRKGPCLRLPPQPTRLSRACTSDLKFQFTYENAKPPWCHIHSNSKALPQSSSFAQCLHPRTRLHSWFMGVIAPKRCWCQILSIKSKLCVARRLGKLVLPQCVL